MWLSESVLHEAAEALVWSRLVHTWSGWTQDLSHMWDSDCVELTLGETG